MFPAGFWSRESVRRFALQLEGERWASACPPLTPRSRRPRTKPLVSVRRPVVVDIGIPPYLVCAQMHAIRRRPVIYALRVRAVNTIHWRAGVDTFATPCDIEAWPAFTLRGVAPLRPACGLARKRSPVGALRNDRSSRRRHVLGRGSHAACPHPGKRRDTRRLSALHRERGRRPPRNLSTAIVQLL